MPKFYLGDSVYVDVEDGMVKLTTENSLPYDPSNTIYMEPEVVESFLRWLGERQPKDGGDA
jgi:hypothetical protein